MKTSLLCEVIVYTEAKASSPRQALLEACSECANACFDVITRLTTNEPGAEIVVLDCLLRCRQCAVECAKYPKEENIQFCGIVCNICANSLKNIAKEISIFSLN